MASGPQSAPSYDQANASILPPEYEPRFERAYKRWTMAKDASHDFDALQLENLDLEKQLDSASKELKVLKEKSTACFAALHTERSRLSRFFGFGKKKDHGEAGSVDKVDGKTEAERREAVKTEFEHAHGEETRQANVVERLQIDVRNLKKKSDALLPIAASCDQAWEDLVVISQPRVHDSVAAGILDTAFEDVIRAQTEYDGLR